MTEDEQMLAERIGTSLRALRRQQGRTQEELANSVGIARTYVAYLERGQRSPSMEMVARIARVLGVDVSELFGGSPDSTDEENFAVQLFRAVPKSQRRQALEFLRVMAGAGGSRVRAERTMKPAAAPPARSATRTKRKTR